MYIDIHTHIDQHASEQLSEIVKRASDVGVAVIVSAGVDILSSKRCAKISDEYKAVFAGVGLHPQDLTGKPTSEELDELERLAKLTSVVVMSEIGLDFQPDSPDRIWQEEAFRTQINIAVDNNLPIVFHNRGATSETLRVLKEERAWRVGGAAHYFQGDLSYADALLNMGFHVSLSKLLLRLPDLQKVAKELPLDSLTLETDAYPQPFKKKRNKWTEPRDVPKIAAALAELHGVSSEEIAVRTSANVLSMIGERNEEIRRQLERVSVQ